MGKLTGRLRAVLSLVTIVSIVGALMLPSLVRPGLALAGEGFWTPLGALPSGSPTQAKVFSFAVGPSNPDVLYAGPSAGGLFKSTDGGATWQQLTNGLPANEFGNFRVTAIGVAPNSPNVVFIGSNGGIFRSTDAGSTWIDVTDGIFTAEVNAIKTTDAIAISPDFATDKTVFLGTSFGRGSGRIFRTTDGGATWQIVGADVIGSTVLDVAVSPSFGRDKTVFSIDFVGPPVKRSVDGGQTWQPLSLNAGVQALGISPNFAADRTVFAVGTSGINKSTDAGATWANSTTEPNEASQSKPVTAVAISPDFATDQAVFVTVREKGVFQSFGGVAPWTPINEGLTDLVAIGLQIQGGHRLFLNAEATGLWENTATTLLNLPSTPLSSPTNPGPDIVYFPETGHNLAFGFKFFWDHNGGLARFGIPRTEEFREVNPADGKVYIVQYFERARFEYHPELKGTPFEVELGLLGRQVTAGREGEASFQPISTFTESPQNRFFPETGHSLAFGFKFFWENNGGLAIYGLPISEEFLEVSPTDGVTRIVQYFERARFEYHPEFKGTPFEVELGLLGNQVLRARGWIS